jgi:Chaperone of endosialidase
MAKDQNFENNGQEFNIHLEDNGDLSFNANDKNGSGNTRMVIADNSGEVAIGGSGAFGQLQLKDPADANTIFLGGSGTEASALLGGAAGQSGRVRLFDSAGDATVDLDGSNGVLILGSEGIDGDLLILNDGGTTTIRLDGDSRTLELFGSNGATRASVQGDIGRVQLLNSSEVVTADLRGDAGSLVLGAAGATDGDVIMLNSQGDVTINCDGESGLVECVTLTETSDGRLKQDIAPLTNALDSVLTLRGVRYRRNAVATTLATTDGGAPQLGFIGQEVEAVCPELVATNADGYKSVNYSRMTAVLVEAVKEQQQQIREQAAALAALSELLGELTAAGQGARPTG